MSNKFMVLLVVIASLGFSAVASATPLRFDFTDLGTNDSQYNNSHTFSSTQSSAYTLNARSLNAVINYNHYTEFGTNDGNGDPSYQPRHSKLYYTASRGLGVYPPGDGQVGIIEAIELRFDNSNTILPDYFYDQMLRLTVGSLQKGEQAKFYVGHRGDGNAKYVGQLTGDGNETTRSFVLPGSELLQGQANLFIVGVRANSVHGRDNFYLRSISSDVPEPSTVALFGFGLIGLGFAARRRRG